jgi:hypothetical protein
MKKEIVDFINNSPIESGIIFIIIGVALLIFKLNKKPKTKFKDSNVLTWKSHVFLLAVIAMSFIYGIILILKNS